MTESFTLPDAMNESLMTTEAQRSAGGGVPGGASPRPTLLEPWRQVT
ncbi:hypothetical protein [Amycolatopsis kentuckyensis]